MTRDNIVFMPEMHNTFLHNCYLIIVSML